MSLSDPPVQGGPAQRLREPGRAQLLAAGADFQAADAKQLGPQAHGACSSASETRGGQPHRLNGAPGSARSVGCPWVSVEAGATGRTRHTRPHSCRGAGSAAQGVRSHVRSAEVRWESGACTEPPLGSPALMALTALTPPRPLRLNEYVKYVTYVENTIRRESLLQAGRLGSGQDVRGSRAPQEASAEALRPEATWQVRGMESKGEQEARLAAEVRQ